MDFSTSSSSPGLLFASNIRAKFGVPVVSPQPDDAKSFWLLASFSRADFWLTPESVSSALQFILGGDASLFAVVEVEERIFKFTVFSRSVGLEVYHLSSFSNSSFRVFFHLWNKLGFDLAKSNSIKDSRPQYDWVQVKSKKSTQRSFVDVVKTRIPDLNKAANMEIPAKNVFSRISKDLAPRSVFSWLRFSAHAKNTVNSNHISPRFRATSTGLLSVTNQAINLDLNLRSANSNPPPLTGSNSVPLGPRHSSLGRANCSRCLSFSHLRPNCTFSVRCNACFRLGHVANSCRFPPRFPGLSMECPSTFQPCAGDWSRLPLSHWFQPQLRMTDGPNPQLAPVFSSFGQLSQVLTKVAPTSPIIIPWKEIPPSAQAGVFPSSSPSSVILPDHQPT